MWLLACQVSVLARTSADNGEILTLLGGDSRPETVEQDTIEVRLVDRGGHWAVSRIRISDSAGPVVSGGDHETPLPLTFRLSDIDLDSDFDVIAVNAGTGAVDSVWQHHADGSFSRILVHRYHGTRAPDDRLCRDHASWPAVAAAAAPGSNRAADVPVLTRGESAQTTAAPLNPSSPFLPVTQCRHAFGRAPPSRA